MVCFKVVHALAAPVRRGEKQIRLQHGSPNNPNPPRLTFGSYCIRAHADVFDKGLLVGALQGYDTSMDIVKEVEGRCRADIQHRGLKCGDTNVVILTNMDSMMCEGIYFEINSHRVRLL